MYKWRKYYIPFCLLTGLLSACTSSLAAHSQGWGKVSMNGEIVDTACAIDTESRDQTIDMGVIPTSVIKQFGKAPPKPFSIRLVDCRWERYPSSKDEWESFTVTFDGSADGDFFTITGDAEGVQLAMYDEYGTQIIAGKELPKRDIVPGDMTLNYELQLVTNNQSLRAGTYHTLLRFKIDYY